MSLRSGHSVRFLDTNFCSGDDQRSMGTSRIVASSSIHGALRFASRPLQDRSVFRSGAHSLIWDTKKPHGIQMRCS